MSHRLDSIAEESETSDNSIRSSNSNQNLNNANPYYVVKSHDSRSIVVHMDTDSSNETGSFDKAFPNFEAQNDEVFDSYMTLSNKPIPARPISPNPISQIEHQMWTSTFCNRSRFTQACTTSFSDQNL